MKITQAAKLLSNKTHYIFNDNNDYELLRSILKIAFPLDSETSNYIFRDVYGNENSNSYGYCRHNEGNWADIGEYLKELVPIKLSLIESPLLLRSIRRKKAENEAKKQSDMQESESEFEKVVNQTLCQIEETLIVKGKEYRRNNNPFHNFEVGARKKNISREKALDGMLLKHEVSIEDMTNDLDLDILPTESAVNEKFGDALIYLIIKKAMLIDRIKNAK